MLVTSSGPQCGCHGALPLLVLSAPPPANHEMVQRLRNQTEISCPCLTYASLRVVHCTFMDWWLVSESRVPRVTKGEGGRGHLSGPSLPNNLLLLYMYPRKKYHNSESLCGLQPIRGQRQSMGGADWLPDSPVNHSCSRETDFFQDVTRRAETTSQAPQDDKYGGKRNHVNALHTKLARHSFIYACNSTVIT